LQRAVENTCFSSSVNTCFSIILLLVVTLTSTTFTFAMTGSVSTTGWTFTITIDFPWNIFCISTNFGQSIILYPFKPHMWHAYEDVFYGFLLGCVTSVVATMVYSFFFLHVSTFWFVIPQFVQCLSIFPVLLYVFTSATYFVFCGTQSALLASVVIMSSSHNIVASLCYCIVNYFILAIVIMRYDYKLALNIVVKKLFVIGTYKPWANFWIRS